MMKKYTITLIASVAAMTAFGQGTVNFATPNLVYVTNSVSGARVVTGSAFKAVLYYLPDNAVAPTTDEFTASGLALGGSANFGPLAGAFVGGTRTAPTVPAGGAGWFQVRAWETAFGADYAQASGVAGALVGTSSIFRIAVTGNPTTVPAGTPASLGGLLQTFTLYPVPEPSVIGLGILGIGALLMLRRRK